MKSSNAGGEKRDVLDENCLETDVTHEKGKVEVDLKPERSPL